MSNNNQTVSPLQEEDKTEHPIQQLRFKNQINYNKQALNKKNCTLFKNEVIKFLIRINNDKCVDPENRNRSNNCNCLIELLHDNTNISIVAEYITSFYQQNLSSRNDVIYTKVSSILDDKTKISSVNNEKNNSRTLQFRGRIFSIPGIFTGDIQYNNTEYDKIPFYCCRHSFTKLMGIPSRKLDTMKNKYEKGTYVFNNAHTRTNNTSVQEWQNYISDDHDDDDERESINNYCFYSPSRPFVSDQSKTFREYMMKKIGTYGMSSDECGPQSKKGTLQRVMYYLMDKNAKPTLNAISKSSGVQVDVPQANFVVPNHHHSYYIPPNIIPSHIKQQMNSVLYEVLSPAMLTSLSKCTTKDEVFGILQLNEGFFDTFHFGASGLYSKDITPIFSTRFPQPRRINFSVQRSPPKVIPQVNIKVQELFVYGSAGRPYLDQRCRKMPESVYSLGEECWKLCLNFLGPLSQQCPPVHCQVCTYFSKFKSKMTLHKDNGFQDEGGKQNGVAIPIDLNSHIFGSDVMIVTLNDGDMDFLLVPPPAGSTKGHRSSTKLYQNELKKGRAKRIKLEKYSVHIHSAHDDEIYMHGLEFDENARKATFNKTRVAFIFRWLCNSKMFRVDPYDDKSRRYSAFEKSVFEELRNGYGKTRNNWFQCLGYSESDVDDIIEKL